MISKKLLYFDLECYKKSICFGNIGRLILLYFGKSAILYILTTVLILFKIPITAKLLIGILGIYSIIMLALEEFLHFILQNKITGHESVVLRFMGVYIGKKLLFLYRIEIGSITGLTVTVKTFLLPPFIVFSLGILLLIVGKLFFNTFIFSLGLYSISQGLFSLIPLKILRNDGYNALKLMRGEL